MRWPTKDHEVQLAHSGLPKVVSLFCGAGGLDEGFRRQGFQVAVAFDMSNAAIRTHRRNFRQTSCVEADLLTLGPAGIAKQVRALIPRGNRIGVIGGPPCQGFSRANTRSQRGDPRNKLLTLYLDIVSRLKKDFSVEFVVFENVLGIRDRKHAPTYGRFVNGLRSLGLDLIEHEMCALDYGVPQLRRRVVVTALKEGRPPSMVRMRNGPKTVREAIGALPAPAFFERQLDRSQIPVHPNHWTMKPKSKRFNGRSAMRPDGRSFKQLAWDHPSPTIAFGHREIHVHPSGHRRLSIYEAMLLQGFPSSFVLEGNLSEQVEQVSNAVPPPLARSVASSIKRALLATA